MGSEYSYQDWLKCPNCGEEAVTARDYHTEVIFECTECSQQRVMVHGVDRPLSHADGEKISERNELIMNGDEEARESRWADTDSE